MLKSKSKCVFQESKFDANEFLKKRIEGRKNTQEPEWQKKRPKAGCPL